MDSGFELFTQLVMWNDKGYSVQLVTGGDHTGRAGWACIVETPKYLVCDGRSDSENHSVRAVSKVCESPEEAIRNMRTILAE